MVILILLLFGLKCAHNEVQAEQIGRQLAQDVNQWWKNYLD